MVGTNTRATGSGWRYSPGCPVFAASGIGRCHTRAAWHGEKNEIMSPGHDDASRTESLIIMVYTFVLLRVLCLRGVFRTLLRYPSIHLRKNSGSIRNQESL